MATCLSGAPMVWWKFHWVANFWLTTFHSAGVCGHLMTSSWYSECVLKTHVRISCCQITKRDGQAQAGLQGTTQVGVLPLNPWSHAGEQFQKQRDLPAGNSESSSILPGQLSHESLVHTVRGTPKQPRPRPYTPGPSLGFPTPPSPVPDDHNPYRSIHSGLHGHHALVVRHD